MHRNKKQFALLPGQCEGIKRKMLNWSKRFSILLFLDTNQYRLAYGNYECLLAAGAYQFIGKGSADPLSDLFHWHREHNDWLFGHIAYDFKNTLEPRLYSAHKTVHDIDDLSFFCPATVCYIDRDQCSLTIESIQDDPDRIYRDILNSAEDIPASLPAIHFSGRVDHEEYIEIVKQLREHIAQGDCYEINFCTERFAESVSVDPLAVFHSLNIVSPAPYAAYYRLGNQYMMCASPERYLRKEQRRLIAQPIKGTMKRGKDKIADDAMKKELRESIKDQAENVMITDLMRNDLARSCVTGSIRVDELFGIYSFPQVHQMISTVSGEMKEALPFTDAVRYSFPMGSMTGAPKIKVMELIETYERSRRALFSGTVGYIAPSGNFDLNVIIRSLFYNEGSKYLSYQTGGAITYDSDPQQEWEEMRLKAWALEHIFRCG